MMRENQLMQTGGAMIQTNRLVQLGVVIYLVVLGIQDLRHRRVSVYLLWGAVLVAFVFGCVNCIRGNGAPIGLFAGTFPGLFMLLVSWLTQKVGMADGIVLMSLGLVLGCRNTLFLLYASLLLIAAFALILLALKRVRSDSRLPFLPFIGLAYLGNLVFFFYRC